MFKCSLSAPAPQHRLSYTSGLPATANPAGQNHPLRQVTMPTDTPPTPYDGTGHLASHHAACSYATGYDFPFCTFFRLLVHTFSRPA
jgi:hypothetical protein